MSPTMTDKQCARCPRKLSAHNTNPDGLCGACQRALSPHHNSPAYKDWLKLGKPRIAHKEKMPQRESAKTKYSGRRIPDPATLPASFLVQCVKELARRRKEAEEVLATLEKYGV